MWLHTVNSPIGALYLTGEGEAVTGLYFRQPAGSFDPPGDLGREAEAQLRAYIGRNTPLEDNGFYANIYPVDNVILRAIEELNRTE